MNAGLNKKIDLLIIKPGAQKKLYQSLSKSISGLEPPLWSALLAAFIREKGFEVRVIDSEVEPQNVTSAVVEFQPKLIAMVVSGTNPSASTMNMVGARTVLEEIRDTACKSTTILMGLHPSALPERTLAEEPVDLVCQGEGFHTLLDLLSGTNYKNIKGLWYRQGQQLLSNPRAKLVDPNELPMPAWDLLPMSKYRAHNWHCFGSVNDRTPYGVIYTSLGCPYNCSFCCINAIFGKHTIRYRAAEKVVEEIDYLVNNFGIKNFKIIDEMFAINEKRVVELCDKIIEKGYDLNMWAYARVNTVTPKMLTKMKRAGINWVAYGFESGNERVLKAVNKGYDLDSLNKIIKMTYDAGLYIGANFIFGLPDDDYDSMQDTLNMALDINAEWANFYATMAYPGSRLYEETLKNGAPLPETWQAYSPYAYESFPLATKHLKRGEILSFRDYAFHTYFENPRYLNKIKKLFGLETVQHIKEMTKHRLKRKHAQFCSRVLQITNR